MNEEWREISGLSGYYVSSLGNVRNNKGEQMSKELSNAGYYRVHLCKGGVAKHYSIHRLVAEAFVDRRSCCPIVNHKDGCKTNNTATNLEWCSHSSNLQHAYDSGLRTGNFGNKNGQCKLSVDDVRDIRKLYKKRSRDFGSPALALKFGVNKRTILDVVRCKNWNWVD